MILRHVLPRALRHASDPGFWRAAKTWQPFSVTSYALARRLAEVIPAPRTVIDGGANVGQFSRAALETWRPDRLIAIEPNPAAAARLRQNLASERNVEIFEFALGSRPGTSSLVLTENSVSSSILQPLASSQLRTEGLAQDVELRPLDQLLSRTAIVGPTLLKLDLQGYESQAILGASEVLKEVDYLLIEVSFAPSYEEEPLADEVFALLRSSTSFGLVGLVDTMRSADGRLLQADALFHQPTTR